MEQIYFIIFGATGDLAKKKLFPALYNLIKEKKYDNFSLIAIGRRNTNIEEVLKSSEKYVKDLNNQIMDELKKKSSYLMLDFENIEEYKKLESIFSDQHYSKESQKIFYFSTKPEQFNIIIRSLKKYNLVSNNSKLVFEKPFGKDLESSNKIDNEIKKSFSESQIYRIDHYLGKELVQNIFSLKFANDIFYHLFNKDYIDHIQIIVAEDFGVETRGAYYDDYGALRDMVQNHMLQLISLITMHCPHNLNPDTIRNKKSEILSKTEVKDCVLGQYKGYLQEKDIKENSKTDTFAALKLIINEDSWKDVPIFLMTGKYLKEKKALIYIQFKEHKHHLFREKNSTANNLIIQIQPDEGIALTFNVKIPGKQEIKSYKLDFCHHCTFGSNTPEAYENLFLDIINSDQSSFVRSDEIQNSWKIIDSIKRDHLEIYDKHTIPNKAKNLIESSGRNWYCE